MSVEAFKAYMKEMKAYQEALNLIFWDMRTKIPKKAMEERTDVVGVLSDKIYQMQTSDDLKEMIETVPNQTSDPLILKAIAVAEEDYQRNVKIPQAEYRQFVVVQAKSEAAWQEAREANDFEMLAPYLEQLIAYNKSFSHYWGYEGHLYDGLLNSYEPGLTTAILDPVFETLKDALVPLIKAIEDQAVDVDVQQILHHFPKDDQKAFALSILDRMGFDFDKGRLDETIHPFAIGIHPFDVRVTTRYDERDFRTALFGTIHEGGHALYEQNFDEALHHTVLADGASMGIHESQSLFWENFIGRSNDFWDSQFKHFLSHAPAAFQTLEKQSFYRAVNEVKPSFIRIEADELTYAMHIILRYELEKELIDGSLTVQELPKAWNDKMEAYLGIRPERDIDGVLQDIHWAAGDFGYFPTYLLGYMYAAQIYKRIETDIHMPMMIKMGDYSPIREWLTEHVHRHGKMKKPLELIEDMTGEGLNPDYLIHYLTDKYTDIYQIK